MKFRFLHLTFNFFLVNIQVFIGSEELKANHSIRQIVEIMSESQKYNKYGELVSVLFCMLK
jgi:ATP-dependent RNA helicase DDX5/DBP2